MDLPLANCPTRRNDGNGASQRRVGDNDAPEPTSTKTDRPCALASGYIFLLFCCRRVGMRFALWRYPVSGETIKFGGSVKPDLGQPQVARTDSAVVRFACPLEAFFGQGAILGGRFHLETPPSAPICSIVYVARATTKSYPLVYA
jgi:hypothetical protein